jgi:glycosyltransferase involved in cell wall biosynthesis
VTIHLDISQLMLDPRRSGIQRAERELIRHWPGPAPLKPCHFNQSTGQMHALPDDVFRVLCEDASPGGTPAELDRLNEYAHNGDVILPERLLNAELFLDPGRADYYYRRASGGTVFWLIYDLLPYLEPQWFGIGTPARMMPYLRALRHVPNAAFISARTRDDCVRHVSAGWVNGPVIPMGGDGLGLEKQGFLPARRQFVMLGTIEPRKNAAPVMQAFKALWRDGLDAHLIMIGNTPHDAAVELALLDEMSGDARFQHLQNLPDSGVRDVLRHARAMIFPSEGEGFGIPPMEALHAGIPVIVAEGLPALAEQPALGQVRLNPVTVQTIGDAVRQLADDETAARLWTEAEQMPVPSWSDFARHVAAWVQG